MKNKYALCGLIILAIATALFAITALPSPVTAASLTSWDGTTAIVTLTSSDLQNIRSDGIFGPGTKTYDLVSKQIDTSKILRGTRIISDLNKKKLKPETYFDTKYSSFLSIIYPKSYRDRIAWDVWMHAQAAQIKFCIWYNICVNADPSPNTIGFNEWFVTDAFGNID